LNLPIIDEKETDGRKACLQKAISELKDVATHYKFENPDRQMSIYGQNIELRTFIPRLISIELRLRESQDNNKTVHYE
jgi:hypothetical protein